MASQEKDAGSSPSSAWASILQAVREQLPSLDSDSSLRKQPEWVRVLEEEGLLISSDCGEEELFIFQRNHPALIPDLSEELAEEAAGAWDTVAQRSPPAAGLLPVDFSMEPWSEQTTSLGSQASPEGRGPGNPVGDCGKTRSSPGMPENTPRWQEGDLGVTASKVRGSQSLPKGPKGEATFVPLQGGLDTGPQSAVPHVGEDPDCARRQALRRERRKMIEKDVLHRVPWEACTPDSTAVPLPPRPEPQEGPLMLSLQQLEELDLDGLLQRLAGRAGEPGEGTPGATWPVTDHLQHQADAERSAQDRLMEQLVLLCASKSLPAASLPDTRALEATARCAPRELNPPGAQGWRLKNAVEPPTVFMDLRVPEHSAQATEESSSSSSEDEDEDEDETAMPRNQQGPLGLRDCTGKTRLLQQLRAFRQGLAQPTLPASTGPRGQRGQAPADTAGTTTQRQRTQARPPGGSARALGDPPGPGTRREALVPPL